MPQFDTFSFLSQLFWVFLLFLSLYIMLLRWVLPALAVTLKVRKKLIQHDGFIGSDTRGLISLKAEPLLLRSSSFCKAFLGEHQKSGSFSPRVSSQDSGFSQFNTLLVQNSALYQIRSSSCHSVLTLVFSGKFKS